MFGGDWLVKVWIQAVKPGVGEILKLIEKFHELQWCGKIVVVVDDSCLELPCGGLHGLQKVIDAFKGLVSLVDGTEATKLLSSTTN